MHAYIKNTILVLVSLSVTCLLAEMLVQLIEPQQLILLRPDIWRPDYSYGWKQRENVRTMVNTGERTVHIITDENGYRIRQKRSVSPRFNILLLGDSFMAAFQVEYEDSVAGRLQSLLSDSFGEEVRVVNTGVDQWDPNQYLIQARAELNNRKYDIVLVFLYMGNDIVSERYDSLPPRKNNERHPFRIPRELTRGEVVQALLYPVNDYLEERSHLFIFLKKRIKVILMRLGLTASYFPYKYYRAGEESPMWETTASICRDIRDISMRKGLEVLFVLIPTPYQVDENIFRQYVAGFNIDASSFEIEYPNRMLKRYLDSYGLKTVNLLPVLRRENDKGNIMFGSVDRHFSIEGNDVVANALLPEIQKILISK